MIKFLVTKLITALAASAIVAMNAAASWAQSASIEAGSWGGKVRSEPSITSKQVGSLQNGDVVLLLEKSDAVMNGYPWFKIAYGNGLAGYQWGGILCGIDAPVEGLFQICSAPLKRPHNLTIPSLDNPDAGIAEISNAERIADCVSTQIAGEKSTSDCIGIVADPCLNDEGKFVTLDLRQCIGAETQIWDDRLNRHYKDMMASLDDQKQKTALRDMQRLWIDYTQAFCNLEYALYEGTMYQVSGDYCMMEMTAKQSMALRALYTGAAEK